MSAELPIRSQIRGIGRQEADWEWSTAYYSKDHFGDSQERSAEGGWSVVIRGAGNLDDYIGSLL